MKYSCNKMCSLNTENFKNNVIDRNLYKKYDVKRGLRDSNGCGVIVGLTKISDVCDAVCIDGHSMGGKLYYYGYDVNELIQMYADSKYFYEIIVYLLLFGKLPKDEEFHVFKHVMWGMQSLDNGFIRDFIIKSQNSNIMNVMQIGVLALYTLDSRSDDISPENVLRQSLELINKMPLIAIYSYNGYYQKKRFIIHNPKYGYSIAEAILFMLRPNGTYTKLEVKVLNIALVLYAEHGGGNNSTFTTHVVTSSGSDTYSSISASIGSLKGFRHGGAIRKVVDMLRDIKEHIVDYKNKLQIEEYLVKILKKEAFDGCGLIYGMGHAVYTISDPREVILKEYARKLAIEKGFKDEFYFYESVEKIAKKLIMKKYKYKRKVCTNCDFYSGFVFMMLGIPEELFMPIFTIARTPGWCAHRLEELLNGNRIIRPSYKYVGIHLDINGLKK